MCGIVGIAGRFGRDQLKLAVHSMTAAVAHRGPDDEGVWVGENFAFGMRQTQHHRSRRRSPADVGHPNRYRNCLQRRSL